MMLTIYRADGHLAQLTRISDTDWASGLVACQVPSPGCWFVCVAGECVKVVSLR